LLLIERHTPSSKLDEGGFSIVRTLRLMVSLILSDGKQLKKKKHFLRKFISFNKAGKCISVKIVKS